MADKTKIIVGCSLAGALLIGGSLGIGLGVVKPMQDKDKKIAQYETQLTEQNKELEQYKQLELDTALLESLKVQVETNKTTIGALESDNAKLTAKLTENEATIAANLDTIAEREADIRSLNGDITYHLSEIDRLKAENAATLAQNANMQQSLTNNTQTINTLNTQNNALNTQILSLNQQIVNLMVEFQKTNNLAIVLNNKVLTLQGVIDYYEQFISTLETSEQAVVTFKLPDGSIHNLQIVNKGSYVTVADPVVDNATFNYWKLDGEQVNPAERPINSNTTFVADMTYSYTIKFFNGAKEHATQQVVEGGTIVEPETPTKENYNFEGWSLDGVNVVEDPTQVEVTGDLNFVAVFTKIKKFVARTWNVEKVSGTNIWSDGENTYLNDTFLSSKRSLVLNKETLTWEAKTWNGLDNISASNIWSDGENTYHSYNGVTKKLNKATSTWDDVVFNNDVAVGSSVWSDGQNIYCNNTYTNVSVVLNKETLTWEEKTWNGLTNFGGAAVWSDGQNIYYSESGGIMGGGKQYVLNKATSTWEEKTWNGLTDFGGAEIFEVDNSIYCLHGSWGATLYKLDKKTSTWKETVFEGFSPQSANYIWSDGENTYYSNNNDHYILV